jgi:CubicO group peptidase (beta-lactamase class C family)
MNEEELRTLLGEHATRHEVPGAAVGILGDGHVRTAFHGTRDVRTGELVTAETRFAAGSLTKSMVATVIIRLANSGRLSMDEAVAEHVPELHEADWANRASIRDLMANRTDLPLRADTEFSFDAHADTDEGALARLVAEVASGARAGRFWSYTNVGWCVLGRVIETATALPWETAMRQLLFDPAGMSGTSFETSPDAQPRAAGHKVEHGRALALEPVASRAYGPAGTTVITTVTDLLRFAEMHLADPSLAQLRVPEADVAIRGWLDAWALGWARFDGRGGPVWGWDGLIGGERCALRLLPDQEAAVAVMANGSTGRAQYRDLLTNVMASFGVIVPPRNLEPSPGGVGDLSRFAGRYAWPDAEFQVTATDRGLLIRDSNREREALPLADGSFVVDANDPDDPTVTFGEFDAAGRPRVLYDMLWAMPRHDA